MSRPRWLPPLAVTPALATSAGAGASVATSLFSIQPLLRRQMPCSDDGIFHIYKALGLEVLIRRGYLFPRWSPEMAHGFGYPLYNFYAPLGSYLVAGLHGLGFIYPAALHIALGLSICLSGLALFALVRDWWGEAAGVGAAALYVTAPYLAFDALFRGALAETLAWVWPPLILWALHRALELGRARASRIRWWAAAAGAYGALVLTHNAAALLMSPLLAGYVALAAWRARDWKPALWGGAALAAGLGLSAYFWGPALAEQGLVQTDRLLVPPIFTYYTNFISPLELLAPPQAADPLLINPSPPKALGLAAALLAGLGLAALARRDVRRMDWPRIAFFASSLLVYAWLTLPASRPVWDRLPLLPFVQFPWRMLMPAALCASILAGAAIWGWAGAPGQQSATAWAAAILVSTVAIVSHLSWWYPRYCAPFAEETVARMLQYEYDTATVGTSAKAEFLPRGVRSVPDDDSLARALMRGEEPNRLGGVPEGAAVDILSADPLHFDFTIVAGQDFDLTYQMFDYAGWTALVDGRPVPIKPTPEHGLIQFPVPAGKHQVSIQFRSTPLRTGAGAMSALFALGLPLLATFGGRLGRTRSNSEKPVFSKKTGFLPAGILFLLALFALKVAWVDRTDNPLRRSRFQDGELSAGKRLGLQLAGGLELLAYEAPTQVEAGGEFDAVLYLAAREGGAGGEYRPTFSIVGAGGTVWNDPKNALPPRWHREPPPTYEWQAGHYAQWARHDTILPATPPGRYRLVGTAFDVNTLVPLSVVDENGSPLSPQFDLGEVVVTRPGQPARPDQLNIEYPSGASFGDGLTLLGYNLDRVEARPGEAMLVTLFWQATRAPGEDATAQLTLHNPDGEAVFQTAFSPASEAYPTSLWQAGDVWRGQHVVRLPPDLPDGEFGWRLRLLGEAAPLGRLSISAPVRVYSQPEVQAESGAQFGDFARLAGYNLSPAAPRPGEAATIELTWEALNTPDVRYRAFVHLADASGRVWAQSDAEPAAWTRPTTGWLPGEFVTDAHQLHLPPDLPPGDYSLMVGLAEVEAGARAPVSGAGATGDGRALIGALTVQP